MPETRLAPPVLDDAFAGNRLLTTFPDELHEMIHGQVDLVELDRKSVV